MKKEVMIKSNQYGMELVLDDQLPFEELLQIIGKKFRESGDFFQGAKMAVSFSGRDLSDEEALQAVDCIMANSTVQIVSILDRDGVQEERMRERVKAFQDQAPSAGAKPGLRKAYASGGEGSASLKGRGKFPVMEAAKDQQMDAGTGFYKGNLRSGQVLECPTSVTLIGDVNPGARIVSTGNVVVLGALKGIACAGVDGDDSCFIFALDMQPIQLQIGRHIAKSPDKERGSKRLFKKEKAAPGAYVPQIALARGGTIYVEPMTKGCLDKL